MPRSMKRPRFTPSLFALEDRSVPSGNVTATLFTSKSGETTLRVNGDEADNSIVLRSDAPGSVTVQGINTSVNGGNSKLTFTGIHNLSVDVADGNDIVRSHDLAVSRISVNAGAGDDTVQLVGAGAGTARDGRVGLSLSVNGDSSNLGSGDVNGKDNLTVIGTTVVGEYAFFWFSGDAFYESEGGRDCITLANTKVDVAQFDLSQYTNGELPGFGDLFTIENLDATVTAENISIFSFIEGSSGDDEFRLKNVSIRLDGGFDVLAEFGVGSYEGNDTIEVNNFTMNSTTEPVDNGFNQTGVSFFADTVRLRNSSVTGGGKFFGDGSGYLPEGDYYTYGSLGIAGNVVDVRNTSVHTNGFGGLFVQTAEYSFDGLARDDSFTFVNVNVSSADGILADLNIDSGGGNDHVRVTNTTSDNLYIALGDGDDELALFNVISNVPAGFYYELYGIDAGSGNDCVVITNSTFPNLVVQLGEGDDTLTLLGNSFDTVSADLGDGDDTAILLFNQATESISVNGGDGVDDLFAWFNFAPILAFDNFEN